MNKEKIVFFPSPLAFQAGPSQARQHALLVLTLTRQQRSVLGWLSVQAAPV